MELEERNQQIVEEFSGGTSVSGIARKYSLTRQQIYNLLNTRLGKAERERIRKEHRGSRIRHQLLCVGCGRPFTSPRPASRGPKYCSRGCVGQALRRQDWKDLYRRIAEGMSYAELARETGYKSGQSLLTGMRRVAIRDGMPWPPRPRHQGKKSEQAACARPPEARDMTGKKPRSRTTTSPLWGGRFRDGPAAIMTKINASVVFDKRLAVVDLQASRAHLKMLARQGIVSGVDRDTLLAGLDQIEIEMAEGRFTFSRELEDVHMNIESRLAEIVGPAAGRLHTARSRNDQVATDFRLWLRGSIDDLDVALAGLQQVFLDQAEAGAELPMPGFTHLQVAQPVTWGLHMLAYVEMLARDRGRFADARKRLNECPLGAAALAGTSFPVDRDWVVRELGFARPCGNSLDAVSDRDFALEFLAAAAILAVHLSRFAEELVLWTSDGFGYVRLPDAFTTGSSIMPQKRNPDAAELVRGKAGRVFGALVGLLATLKGLPLAYAKDMQEDKEPVFDTADTLALCVAATTGMVRDMVPLPEVLERAAGSGASTATDLADWLVRTQDLPFRDAHHAVGAAVRLAEERGVGLAELPLAELRSVVPQATEEVRAVLGVRASIESRNSYGGTAPKRVRERIAAWRSELKG